MFDDIEGRLIKKNHIFPDFQKTKKSTRAYNIIFMNASMLFICLINEIFGPNSKSLTASNSSKLGKVSCKSTKFIHNILKWSSLELTQKELYFSWARKFYLVLRWNIVFPTEPHVRQKHQPCHQNSAVGYSQPQPWGGEFFPSDFTIIKESLNRQTG